MPSVSYILDHPYLKGTKKLKRDEVTILISVYLYQNAKVRRSTQCKIIPKDWDFKSQCPKVTHNDVTLGDYLDDRKIALRQWIRKRQDWNKKDLIEYIDQMFKPQIVIRKPSAKPDLLRFITQYQQKKKQTRSPGYLRNFKHTQFHLQACFGDHINIERVDYQFMETFADYLIENTEMVNNNIHANLKRLGTVLRDAVKNSHKLGINIDLSFDDYTFKEDIINMPRLTWDEFLLIKGLTKSQLATTTAFDIRNLAILRGYSGLRISDMRNISRSSVIEERGNFYYNYTMQKNTTGKQLLLPVEAMEIITLYNYDLPGYATYTHNRTLKEIGELAGIDRKVEHVRYRGKTRIVEVKPMYEYISSHTFRRTFGRKLWDEGVDLETIRSILGHGDSKNTRKYIGVTHVEGNQAISDVFNPSVSMKKAE